MGITIHKTKAKQKTVHQQPEEGAIVLAPDELDDEALVDEYGKLDNLVTAFNTGPVATRFKECKEALNKRLEDELEPQDGATLTGHHFRLEVGSAAKAAAKITDMHLTHQYLGDDLFFKVAKVTLSDLKKYLTPDQLAQVLDQDTGYTKRRKVAVKFLG